MCQDVVQYVKLAPWKCHTERRKHKIVGNQTTLRRSIRCTGTPIALLLLVSGVPLLLHHLLTLSSFCLPTRSSDHIIPLIFFFQFCAHFLVQYANTIQTEHICRAILFIYLLNRLSFVIFFIDHADKCGDSYCAQLIKVITNKFVRRCCFTQQTNRANYNLSSWIIIFTCMWNFVCISGFWQSGVGYQYLPTKTQTLFGAMQSTCKTTKKMSAQGHTFVQPPIIFLLRWGAWWKR